MAVRNDFCRGRRDGRVRGLNRRQPRSSDEHLRSADICCRRLHALAEGSGLLTWRTIADAACAAGEALPDSRGVLIPRSDTFQDCLGKA